MTQNGERSDDRRDAQGGTPADGDYGFSGRGGYDEGNYSGAYGRGAAGARDNPSASGVEGAGTARGGNAIPAPDPADGLRVEDVDDASGSGGEERAPGGTRRTGP